MTSPATPSAPPGAGDKLDARVMKIASVVVLGAIMSILDTTVVSVALPTFQTVFDATYAQVAWTMTGYTLALATVIPLTGWAADRFGTKRLYMLALTLFILGSIACGLAWNIQSLITFRILQGFGGGMLMPLGMTIMTRAAGPARIGRVMAVLGVPMLLGPIAGRLTDKMGPGKFVLGGIALIAVGMGVFTQITDTTSYGLILGALFVMGMGMGMTMMPIMTAALASLSNQEVARGSTLMNIVQQTAASIGTAVMSVILTDQLLNKPAVQAGKAVQADPSQAANFPPELLGQIPAQMSEAFAFTFWVALVLILLTFIPAALLPRKAAIRATTEAREPAAPVIVH